MEKDNIVEVQEDLRNIANELRSIAYELKKSQVGIGEISCANTIENRANYYDKKKNKFNNIKIKGGS